MRDPGDILLVSCYEPGHQPQGIASAVAHLRAAGFAPACIDLAVEPLESDGACESESAGAGAAASRLRSARLVVLSTPMHTALTLALRVAARVRRENPSARLCFFGLYAVLNEPLVRRTADAVFGPDCEQSLVALAVGLEAGLPAELLPGQDRPVAPGRATAPSLVPERDALPQLSRYARLAIGDERRVVGHAETTRGCKHLCRHCPIPPVYGGRFFAVPAEVVLEDVRRQVAAGARHVDFGDPDFLNGPTHALRIARALHAEHPDLTFNFTAKVEHIVDQRAMFPELRALGALFVVSAVESLSDRVLSALDKGHRGSDVPLALSIVRQAGLSLRPTFVAFTPWTTLEDYLALCAFIRDSALEDEVDPVQLSIRLLVPPGSLLVGRPELAPHLAGLDEEGLTYRWTHPDPRMDRLEADVSALVEEAVAAGESPSATFGRIHRLAAERAGISLETSPPVRLSLRRRPPPPPRLTESWFCCAQPTRRQLGGV